MITISFIYIYIKTPPTIEYQEKKSHHRMKKKSIFVSHHIGYNNILEWKKQNLNQVELLIMQALHY